MAADDYDVAVVGGGLVGVATAWGLAREGCRVVVLDEGDRAVRASRGNFALVWVQSKGLGLAPYAGWTIRSSNAWAGFAETLKEETGLDVCFQRPGGFHLSLSERELEARANSLKRLHNQPGIVDYKTEILDHAQVAKMLPDIGPEVVGGSYCPLDGHVNSLRLFRTLHTALNARGVTYLPSHRVENITKEGGEFRLTTPHREIRANRVALAAGNANMHLAPMVGLECPMRPERGQIVVTERLRPFLHHPVVTLRQTDEGTVMIGDSEGRAYRPGRSDVGRQRHRGRARGAPVPVAGQRQRRAYLERHPRDDPGRFPDLRRIGKPPRRLHRVLPFGRDACRQSCAHCRADDRARRSRQVAGCSLQCAEVPCSRGWLTPVLPSR